MRSVARSILIALFVSTSLAWAGDGTSPDRVFGAGTAAFAEQDYRLALSQFQQARDLGLDGPAVRYNIGVCHYKLEDYGNAHAEFSSLADGYPAMRGLAYYNLGLVAQKQSDEATAEDYFQRALANATDEKLRVLARQQLLPESSGPAGKQWLSLVEASIGHDDNVLLLAEDVPLPDGGSAESSYGELMALVSGPLSSAPGFRVDGTIYAVRYADASFFDQTVLRFGGAYQWRWGGWHAEVGPHLSHTRLAGDGLEQRAGVGVRFRRAITARTSLGIRYLHDEVAEGDDRFAYLAGSREWLELRLDRRGDTGHLTLAYAHESNDRALANVSPTRDKLSLRYRYSINSKWHANVGASLRDSRYEDMAEPRGEDLSEVSLALARDMPRGWQLQGKFSVADNDSAVETFAYDRNRTSIAITTQF